MEVPATISGRPVTKRGVHLHPSGYHGLWMESADYWCGLLVDMGISWVVALSDSDALYTSGAAAALLDAGVIPIVRFQYELPRPWGFGEQTAQLAALYQQYGAPLVVQFANEPFDAREWKDNEVPPYEEAWSLICQRWHEAANAITGNGGVAGFPDGPCYDENPFLRIGDGDGHWAAGRAVYLGHHYGKGRPLAYPQDDVSKWGLPLTMEEYREALDDFADDPQWNWVDTPLEMINAQRLAWADPDLTPLNDDTCWRGWEKVQHWAWEAFDFNVQMAMTEGGWVPRDRAGTMPVDIRWPYTTPRMVAAKTLAMYNGPSPLFAVCPWLLADEDMGGSGWPYDAWHGWAFSELYGPRKPVIQALIDNPPGGGTMIIRDRYGEIQDWAWLVAHYGPLVVHSGFDGPGWRIVELRENADIGASIEAPAVIIATFLNADGSPAVGQEVCWYWPDAPEQPGCVPANGLAPGILPGRYAGPGTTNGEGDIGFALSEDAYYEPPAIGPHALWPCCPDNAESILGLGMLAGTNHYHMDVVYQWVEGEPPPSPPDLWDEIEIHLARIDDLKKRIGWQVNAIRALREA